MTTTQRLAQALLAGVLALGMAGTAMADKQTRNTVIGAGVGGVAGAMLSDGDPWMTLGGAAAGGVLGHVLTEDEKRDRRHWNRGDRRSDYYKRADYRKHDKHRGKGHHKHHHRHHR